MTLEEAANGLLFLDKAIEDHKKFDEEIKVRDSIDFLKDYCDKRECEGCYIRRKAMLSDNAVMFQHGSCLFKTLISFLGEVKDV